MSYSSQSGLYPKIVEEEKPSIKNSKLMRKASHPTLKI